VTTHGMRVHRLTGLARRACTGALAAAVLALGAMNAAAQIPIGPLPSPVLKPPGGPRPTLPIVCGEAGQACCRAPASLQNREFGPLVSCKQGLGCDLASGTCVAPCGGIGQACCDGPETRALRWTSDGRVLSPNSPFLREMCSAGACDKASHRCFACGTADGAPCCPPDAAQATARCIGDRLSCHFDATGFNTSGTCHMCGIRGREPCPGGCDPGLGMRQGLCEACSHEGEPPCDGGCQPNMTLEQGICRGCGHLNQRPCGPGCLVPLGVRGGLCVQCGGAGQGPCDNGCKSGLRLMSSGVCVACGHLNQPPCQAEGRDLCAVPLRVAGGLCQTCGAQGQIACDRGCDAGLTLVNNLCQRPSAPEPENCATLGQACSPPTGLGIQCCQSGPPLLCIFNQCRACIPSGQVCPPGPNQTCCKFGDVCRLEVEDGKEKVACGVPD
jgi:hypothetical protein